VVVYSPLCSWFICRWPWAISRANVGNLIPKLGFEIRGGGKGAHRKFTHENFPGAVTISGNSGDDAKPVQVY